MASTSSVTKKAIAIAAAIIIAFAAGYLIGGDHGIEISINHNGVAASDAVNTAAPVTVAPTPVTEPITALPEVAPSEETPSAAPEDNSSAATTTSAAPKDESTKPAASGAPSSKADILKLFNESANNIKTSAKSVTRNWEDLQHNEEKLVVPSALQSIGKTLIGTFLKKNETPVTWSGADIDANYPVKGTGKVSAATQADLTDATCTDDGKYYNITLKFKECTDPTTNGVGNAFNIMKGDEIMNAAKVVQSFSVVYYDAKIECKIDKATGRMVHATYTLPSVLSVTAKVLVSTLDAQVGMTFIDDYTIEY